VKTTLPLREGSARAEGTLSPQGSDTLKIAYRNALQDVNNLLHSIGIEIRFQ
jgi:hypothetical protein